MAYYGLSDEEIDEILPKTEVKERKAQEELEHYKKALELLVFGGLVKQEKVDQALDVAKTFFKK